MFSLKSSLAATATLLSVCLTANATTDGFQSPYGSNGDFAVFDKFTNLGVPYTGPTGPTPSIVLTNQAPILEDNSSAAASLFSAVMNANMIGMAPSGGLRLYNAAGADSHAFNLAINGTANSRLTSFSLQIRITEPDGYEFGDTFSSFLTVSLNGVAGTANVLIDDGSIGSNGSGENARNYGLVQWTWDNLAIESGDSFEFLISSPAAGHASIDALRVDAIPEPSTYALIGAGMLGAAFLRRRRKAA